MKKIAILLAVVGLGVFLMLTENDKKELKKEGKKFKKKLKKTHFPGKESISFD